MKAQVLTGGRGKAGGIKIGNNRAEIEAAAKAILGMEIKGLIVDRVMVAEAVEIAAEFYFSFAVDRNAKSVVMILSREGGVEIEEVAAKTPEKIHKIPIFPFVGIPDFLAKKAAAMLFDEWSLVNQGYKMIQNLYKLMVATDASLVEVNPLVVTKDGSLLPLTQN